MPVRAMSQPSIGSSSERGRSAACFPQSGLGLGEVTCRSRSPRPLLALMEFPVIYLNALAALIYDNAPLIDKSLDNIEKPLQVSCLQILLERQAQHTEQPIHTSFADSLAPDHYLQSTIRCIMMLC